jgi:hypothetical protein
MGQAWENADLDWGGLYFNTSKFILKNHLMNWKNTLLSVLESRHK